MKLWHCKMTLIATSGNSTSHIQVSARNTFDLEKRPSNKSMILEFCKETLQILEVIQVAMGRMNNSLITEAIWIYK